MKKVGIWMDKEKAYIVRLKETGEKFETLFSNLEFFSLKNGSTSRMKSSGAQQIIHESRYLEREKHQLRTYFSELAFKIKNAEEVVVFGPGDTNEKFRKSLLKNYRSIAAKVKVVAKADSKTENQIRALVRKYYHAK
ncbi:hypothetical protein KCTC52924_00583 [Arenibacter antarcticus]|uniref:Uncharacterized protein n=1 Tax=Arenibacter antarcticus TaxID=2040469 RepID=A0ABW5VBK7_9FLAO|nr:hypothetical protein [Arenibacter sp. H213]MCM4169350.1 hypothetical protein [Arenibacter sp. H213]